MNVSKTIYAFAFSVPIVISGLAQTASHSPATAHKTGTTAATPGPALKTAQDSLSYAIGLSLANFYKQQNLTNINTAIVVRAVNDVKNNKPLLNEQQAQTCIMNFVQKTQSEKAVGNKKTGQDFLAANSKKPGVVTTASGLQYQIVKQGTGLKPALTDQVRVHYRGTLIDGKVFDSSIERGQPVELSVNGVIPGWTEALQLMPVGSKWKLFIPSELAYGDRAAGQSIPAGSTLVFDVELLDIVSQTPPAVTDSASMHPAAQPDSTKKPQ
jgi:FKBP-type peptidyl-prolyl cis-trans isomerase FklB